ncbi:MULTISPECIES: hypothetical protein [unclassified Variovorax]|jgi:hypothetical protein|uniref:hypothetical protein n=1 Tax=unclassified Variovorax TaxID=663243 RepID=UPI0008CEAFAB|nr:MULTISPECIES: hypothetical protein [unclassified Variovorax]SEK07208.1 hypothetical protein SAMN05518853_107284 [Variovorax sp. OK202]SFD49586.1 hypothetical protein SAMN05444746_107284 [Variovorax sp. OK212]
MSVETDYKGLLDTSFDPTFASLELPSLPWVGSRYASSQKKTIVLGESVYAFGKNDAHAASLAYVASSDALRRMHLNRALALNSKKVGRATYVRNFERAVYLKSKTSPAERQRLWSELAFFNLVHRPMKTRKHRPDDADYLHGWASFFTVAAALGAERCVVYGTEWPKIDALRDLCGAENVTRRKYDPIAGVQPSELTATHEGRSMAFLFIRHPSAFFPWSDWGAWMRSKNWHLAPAA